MKMINGIDMKAGFLSCIILAAAAGCTDIPRESNEYNVRVQAAIGSQQQTARTSIADDEASRRAEVLWADGDRIGVAAISDGSISTLSLLEGAGSRKAVFGGSVTTASPDIDTYYAFYPNSASAAADGKLHFTLPAIQSDRDGAIDAAECGFMVAECDNTAVGGMSFFFENLFPILKLSVSGSGEHLAQIVFAGSKGERVAGGFTVDMTGGTVTFDDDAARRIILDCHNTALASEPKTFYIVVPAFEYASGYSLRFVTADGGSMLRTVGRTGGRVLQRSKIYALPALTFASEQRDLSCGGTANCYIASEAGRYRFDATVIGNGPEGIIAGSPHKSASIVPASAEISWQQPDVLIDNVVLDVDGGVSFSLSDQRGNGVIAVRDAEGKILWSWHIWAADDLTAVAMPNGLVAADRNLGAASTAEEGLFYQWGRKDPLYRQPVTGKCSTIAAAFSSPEIFFTDWSSVAADNLWSAEAPKSIYDPCPAGWRVASKAFYSAIYPTYDADTDCAVCGSLRLPFTGYLTSSGRYDHIDNYGYYWTNAAGRSTFYGTAFQIFYNIDDKYIEAKTINNRTKTFALPVRCVSI